MVQWADFPFDQRMYADADETILSKAVATVENAFANAAGGHSRFPGLTPFSSFPGQRVYLDVWRDNIIAATSEGRVYLISKTGAAQDVTGVPLSGGRRTIFTATEDQVVMASGGPIISLSSSKTQLLSRDAPDSSHVAFIDGYLLATEPYSGRFFYSDPGQYTVWNPLSVFTANGKPDDLVSMVVTPFRELMLAGSDHIEQWESLPSGTQPFSRRWSTGEGVEYPYTLIADKTGTFGVNKRFEFVRFFGQISQDQGADIGLVLENIDDWTDAWAAELSVKGQKLFLLQMPKATNVHGTPGVTLVLDTRSKKWSFLFGWDAQQSVPTRWPGWSTVRAWGKVFCGITGGIAVFDNDNYEVLGQTLPFLVRTGHVSKFGPSRIDDLRIRMRRGEGGYNTTVEPLVGIRVNRDNLGFDQWCFEPLGLAGQREMVIHFGGQGYADTWQFEIMVSDNVPVEFVDMQIYVEEARW